MIILIGGGAIGSSTMQSLSTETPELITTRSSCNTDKGKGLVTLELLSDDSTSNLDQ